MKAIAYFHNDPSVGIFSAYYEMELPFNEFEDSEHREEVRKQIKDFYTLIDNDMTCTYVYFSDENQSD